MGDTTDIDDMAKRRHTLPKTSAKVRLNVGVNVKFCLLRGVLPVLLVVPVWLLLAADNDDDDIDDKLLLLLVA